MKRNVLALLLAFCLILTLPICANASPAYVQDNADILSPAEEADLADRARQVAEDHDFAVYILTVEDFTDLNLGNDIEDANEALYRGSGYGIGDTHRGVLLMLSMETRKYAIFVDGDGDDAFDGVGHSYLSEQFLDDFADDQWYNGFVDYISTADELLIRGEAGEPISSNPPGFRIYGVIACILLAVLAAFLVTRMLKSQLTSVHEKTEASDFIAQGGLKLTSQSDLFTHRTQTRTYSPEKKDNDSSDSDSSSSSGSF